VTPRPGWVIAAGAAATLLGVGLQRFAYAALLPALVGLGGLSGAEASLLAAANFAGYLAGAALAPWVGRLLGMRPALRGAMLLATLCFALCAVATNFAWLVPWRVLAGIAGGVLMILAGPAVQQAVPPGLRARAAGVVFMGVGSGIVIGAAVVPLLLPAGIPATWLALAAVSLLLSALSWPHWPNVPPPPRMPPAKLRPATLRPATIRLVSAYALSAAAATPHMGWWPDYIARGLGQGTSAGAAYWMLFGAASFVAPVLFTLLGERIGTRPAYVALLGLQALGLALPLVGASVPVLALSTILAAATTVGSTALTLTRARELAGDSAAGVWRLATMGWAAAQVGSGFVLAGLLAATGSHLALFAAGLVAALLAMPLAR
jgi:predicted MFS family arabinose efflux permease